MREEGIIRLTPSSIGFGWLAVNHCNDFLAFSFLPFEISQTALSGMNVMRINGAIE